MSSNLPIYLLTNNHHLWLLRGFAYFWNKYFPEKPDVVIAGYDHEPYDLPMNFKFISLGPTNTPSQMWSNGLIKLADDCLAPHFILMLEDYWLNAPVKMAANHLNVLAKRYCIDNVLRIDLSGNRASYKQARPILTHRGFGLIETPPGTPYNQSFQAAIWNRDNLLDVLELNESPWESEIEGSKRVDKLGLRVFGVKEKILSYNPIWRTKTRQFRLDKFTDEDKAIIDRKKFLEHG